MVNESQKAPVSAFSSQWLSLREPADHTARNASVTSELQRWAMTQQPLQVMELGTGTGSNLRYLCPLLGHDQQWTLLDNDPLLLEELPGILEQWASSNRIHCTSFAGGLHLDNKVFSARVHWQQQDLANDLSSLPFAQTQLLTGSALLDLTSSSWLRELAGHCVDNQCASLFVLNYDGRVQWEPPLNSDAWMCQQLNTHQLNDKGFGAALGPQAGSYFAEQLQHHQKVSVQTSDWQLTPEQQPLQEALIAGWAEAATEQSGSETDEHAESATSKLELIEHWKTSRLAFNRNAESSLTVGHTDILTIPDFSAGN